MKKTYVIIPTDDITEDMIAESCHNNYAFRTNSDGSDAILKFCAAYPNTVAGYPKYSHNEILQYLEDNKIAWGISE